MTSQAEETFQARGKEIAERLEKMAQEVRHCMLRDYSAIERASDIVHGIQWDVASLPLRVLIKRAALADKGRDNE